MKIFSARSSRFYLLLSITAAIIAALSLFAYTRGINSRVAENGKLVSVVVAARDLRAGEVLDASSLSRTDFPDRYLLPGICRDPFELAGSILRHDVGAGEPLLQSAVQAMHGGGLACTSLVTGFRAYPLPSSSVSFPTAELKKGSRVDVIKMAEEDAFILLENVEVLALYGCLTSCTGSDDAFASSMESPAECILLQVTPEEACRLAAAQEGGQVEVVLRPDGEI